MAERFEKEQLMKSEKLTSDSSVGKIFGSSWLRGRRV